MKVLQILPELNAGGVERGTLELARYLVQNGHESIVVSNGGRLVSALENEGSRHLTMPVHRKSFSSLLQIAPLRRVLESERPDILHIHSRVPGWIAWFAWRKLAPPARPRLITTVHGFYSVSFYSAIMTRGERVIAVSECIGDYIARHYPRTPQNAVRLVPHGIDPVAYPRGFQPAMEWQRRWDSEFPQLRGRDLLLLPGRITRLKGHREFLELVAALRRDGANVHGLIVGDVHPRKQAYLAELKRAVSDRNLDSHVTFTGHRADVREIMALSRAVFSLSTVPESFGLTTLEALALGRPVVGYNEGGVGEQLRALFPQGIVQKRDLAALLEIARRVLAEAGEPAPLPVKFTRREMCERTLGVYHELLTAAPSGPEASPRPG